MMLHCLILFWVLLQNSLCDQWPYDRYYGKETDSGEFVADSTRAVQSANPQNHFIHWLHDVSKTQDSAEVRQMFVNDTIPRNVTALDEVFNHLKPPAAEAPGRSVSQPGPPMIPNLPASEAENLFQYLKYPLDPKCTADKSKWWYRTIDGSCNWLKKDEASQGSVGTARSRDFKEHHYANGIATPRDGPNARAVSNAFFARNKTLYYEHTPLLIGLIEFIMHDVTYSMDSNEFIEVKMPPDEPIFPKNTTFRVPRTKAISGTGTSQTNPREIANMATTWLDISSLYGSTSDVAQKLRSFKGGKLLTQEVKAGSTSRAASYLPFNTKDVPTKTTPGLDPKTLFAGGDARTNEDWLLLSVHTLLLREHNRLCDLLVKQQPEYVDKEHPEHTDERIYQTVRLLMSAKYSLIANAYQMSYWNDKMPWPRDDGFPLYRQMYGKDFMEINPMNTYPWPLVTKGGKPMVISAEMAVVYRFHEFIINEFPIKDAKNDTIRNQSVFETGFNSKGFIDTGLESILRGMVNSHIPNFKSGVDEAFRSARHYEAAPFDISTWSIIHEREQGLPTYNTYFRAYNKQDPKVVVKVPETFEQFTSDPEKVKKLRSLYKTPDEVDLVVGVQLDETYFPGTTVPTSALIISLFSLFGMGNSDRFSIGFALTRCFLVDEPNDCNPSNALEELLWIQQPQPGFPNLRRLDDFWLNELDVPAHGTNLLWRLVTENTEIKCLQKDPLFPADPLTNPVICSLPEPPWWKIELGTIISNLQLVQKLKQSGKTTSVPILMALVASSMAWMKRRFLWETMNIPYVYFGQPVVGVAYEFSKDPKSLLLKGFAEHGETLSRCFGLKLSNLVHFVITHPADLEWMQADNAKEEVFSLHKFMEIINFPLIVHKDNFESGIHVKLIHKYLTNSQIVSQFGATIVHASNRFIDTSLPKTKMNLAKFVPTLMLYIATVAGACIVGEEVFDHPDLIQIFTEFNDHAVKAMGFSALLPKQLQAFAASQISTDYGKAQTILKPIIKKRRKEARKETNITLLDFLLKEVEDDDKLADLIVIIVWGGLTNLQATFPSLVLDIINEESTRRALADTCASLDPTKLSVFDDNAKTPDAKNSWTPLRAAMFESIRLSGPITGPARYILKEAQLPSSMPHNTNKSSSQSQDTTPTSKPQILPKEQVATLSAYYTHRSPSVYGSNADKWVPDRFLRTHPEICSPKYITWGLKGPHSCPGRWFAQACILLMTKCLLGRYDIVPDKHRSDDEKYIYEGGNVIRRDVGVTIAPRAQDH